MNLKLSIKTSLFLLILPSLLFSQERLDGVAAIVGDEVILHSEVNQFAAQFAIQSKIDLNKEPEKFEQLRKLSLENLVVQKIMLAKAREDTVTANEEQVEEVLDNQIQNWMQQLGSESKIEEYFGMTVSKIKRQFREEVRNRLMVEAVQGQYAQKITITRPEVEQFYEVMKDSLPDAKEMVEVAHILRGIKAGGEGRDQALQKIKEVQQKIKDGEDFKTLAEQYSEDPGSAKRGGELGLIQRGDFVKEFEEVAFNLKEGETSDIVESQFGFHIIRIIEKRGERVNARHILISLQPSSDDAESTKEFLSTVRDSIKNGADFSVMVKRYSEDETTVETEGNLGWFEIEQMQLPEFKKALENMKVGDISEPVRTDYGFHVIKLTKRREGGELSLDKDWQQVEQWALAQKRNKEMQTWVESLREKIYVEIKADSTAAK